MWLYYMPTAAKALPENAGPCRGLQDQVETLGGRQAELMLRARGSQFNMLTLAHGRQQNAERMAARRLVARGLLNEPNYLGVREWGYVYAYSLTTRGRTCWLRVQKELA